MTLYLFTRDEPGVSNCAGDCLVNWPPLLVRPVVKVACCAAAEVAHPSSPMNTRPRRTCSRVPTGGGTAASRLSDWLDPLGTLARLLHQGGVLDDRSRLVSADHQQVQLRLGKGRLPTGVIG